MSRQFRNISETHTHTHTTHFWVNPSLLRCRWFCHSLTTTMAIDFDYSSWAAFELAFNEHIQSDQSAAMSRRRWITVFSFLVLCLNMKLMRKTLKKNKRHQSNKKNGAATPELGRPHTRIKLLDCTLTSWMDMIKCDRIMKIFPGPSSIRTIKSLLKPWKPTAEGVELLLRARVLEAALFVAGGAYFCITWCFSQLLCSWTEFLYASDSHS